MHIWCLRYLTEYTFPEGCMDPKTPTIAAMLSIVPVSTHIVGSLASDGDGKKAIVREVSQEEESVRLHSYFRSVAALAIAALFSISSVSAAVIGGFATDGTGTNADITITLTSINFGPNPNLQVTSSTLTYGAGSTPLSVGTLGDIANASAALLPLNDFMTYAGTPLDFTLVGVGPGSSNTNCAGLANFGTCSIPLGGGFISPIVLELQNGDTVASLTVFGTVTDGTGTISSWSGTLSATLTQPLSNYTNPASPNEPPTPGDIEAYFAANPTGSITTSHGDTFTAAVIPEPESWALMFGGFLMGAGVLLRRKRAKA